MPSKGRGPRKYVEMDEHGSAAEKREPPPEEQNWFQILSFGHLNPLLETGYTRPVFYEDLPPLSATDRAKNVGDQLQTLWEEEVKACAKTKKKPSLLRVLVQAHGREFATGNLLKLPQDMLLFAGPFLLERLVRFVDPQLTEDSAVRLQDGAVLVLGLFMAQLVQSLFLHQYFNKVFHVAMQARTGLMCMVYRKALSLSHFARQDPKASTGSIINMMQVDVQRLLDFVPYASNLLWSSPFQVLVCVALLWRYVGVACLAGLATILAILPINMWAMKELEKVQTANMEYKDKRVHAVSELLSGIRLLKFFSWELPARNKVMEVREREMQALRRFGILGALQGVLWSSTTAFVALATFGTYTKLGNRLSLEVALPVLSLITILQFPLAVLPWMFISSISFRIALGRIEALLLAPSLLDRRCRLDPPSSLDDNTDVVCLRNVSLEWEQKEAVLRGVSLSLPAGGLVALVGPVGAGKSTLLAALLGELNAKSGSVSIVSGKIGYVPQQAWVVNASLRDNILMGEDMDHDRYAEAIHVSGLEADLKALPVGDRTEIGERGINLSGGQKQRVGLARAVYSRAALYILDDPLSAVDSHVAQHILSKCILGAMAHSARVLVTHRVDLLRHLPYIVVLGDKGVTAQGSYHELVAQGVDMGIHDSDTASTGSAEAHVQESLSEHAKDAGAVASDAAPDSREHHEASARAQLSWCDAALVDVSRDADVSREVEVRAGAKAERMSGERVGTAAEVGGKGGAGGVAEEGSDGVHRRGSEDILKREHPFQRRASDDSETQRHGPAEEGKMIIQEEERETGLVNPATYRSYFSSVGQQMMVAVMLFGAGSQIAHVLTGWCIAAWASDDSLLPEEAISRRSLADGAGGRADGAEMLDVAGVVEEAWLSLQHAPLAAISLLASQGGQMRASGLVTIASGWSQRLWMPQAHMPEGAEGAEGAERARRDEGRRVGGHDMQQRQHNGTASPPLPSGGASVPLPPGPPENPPVSPPTDGSSSSSSSSSSSPSHVGSSAADGHEQGEVLGGTAQGGGGDSHTSSYILLYFLLVVVEAATTFCRDAALAIGSLRASTRLHNQMLQAIIKCPMSFFDATPLGRVLNRFSKDQDIADGSLPKSLNELYSCALTMVGTIALMVVVTPISLLGVVPVMYIYYSVFNYYRCTSREIKRLEANVRSPIYAHFTESINGVACLRAFNFLEGFERESQQRIDALNRVFWPMISCNRWLGLRLELCGNALISSAALAAVIARCSGDIDHRYAGLLGLSVTYALGITNELGWMVRQSTEAEANMNSIERIDAYSKLAPEAGSHVSSDKRVPSSWPTHGRIVFHELYLRYRPSTPLVLRGLSLTIEGGEKVGICGRTGAGKSSLLMAFFRIVEADAGSIRIDDIDIKKVGLHTLRSRLAIVPQDPVLFNGTIRYNMDPFEQYTDKEIWTALETVNLRGKVKSLKLMVHESGANFSLGERQLMCMGRALLRKAKILVLDEATAAIDMTTDNIIQKALRENCQNRTVLTIAHRLHTIMDYDKVVVLDQGKVVECDSPAALIADPRSMFAGMVRAHQESGEIET